MALYPLLLKFKFKIKLVICQPCFYKLYSGVFIFN